LQLAGIVDQTHWGIGFLTHIRKRRITVLHHRESESAHPVFGRIIENYDLVVRISTVPTRNDNPVTPIRMISARVQ
jgi:cyclophilin family peptidyl-prolyl cis-trans isomerase